jgi:hypothetical protein
VIGSGWQTFVQVGLALAQIRDDRLYRVDLDTFERYSQVKWQYGRNYVNHLISAAQVFPHSVTNGHQKPEHETNLVTTCHQTKPEYESQVRPLVGLTGEDAQSAWERAAIGRHKAHFECSLTSERTRCSGRRRRSGLRSGICDLKSTNSGGRTANLR